MRFPGPLVPAVFLSRPNRFLGIVFVEGEEAQCYIPNPGRMEELLYPGARVYLLERASETRKTSYNLVLVDKDGALVSIDSMVPNRVVSESIAAGLIREFRDLEVEKAEHTWGDSRLDFLLRGDAGQLLLEVKSCTLVREGVGLFPDAPTARGSRHLQALADGLEMGRAAVFFLIQRPDAERMRPNEATDPEFAANLREVHLRGVEVYAYTSRVNLGGVFLGRGVQVQL
ncbi:MAG: DNA/RNA nuclease SfsA [Candidatus Bathyarchaeota archaeon]|nr:MAG: DNA/RNA nuclease SfsA [Candidatus Bathyarchaeota archaeon]